MQSKPETKTEAGYDPDVRIGILTREYPPDVYGGAGVHVDFLVRRARQARRRRCPLHG